MLSLTGQIDGACHLTFPRVAIWDSAHYFLTLLTLSVTMAVPTVTQYKDVGVLLTSNLSFTAHLNSILSKAYNSLGMVRRLVPSNCNSSLKRSLYLTLVRSQVTYCCQVWRPYLIRDIKALERLQRRASKYIIDDYHLDYKSRLKSLNFLPLSL